MLEFYAVGSRLVGRVAGVFGTTEDKKYSNGILGVITSEDVRDIEIINLDGIPEAEALRIIGVDEKGNDIRAAGVVAEKQQMGQAKVVDAASAIPELKALHEQFKKLTAERVTAPFEAEVARLNAGYVGGIDREIASEKKAGHLDGVIALEAEKKLIPVAGGIDPGTPGSMSRATIMPIPAEDAETTTEALKKLRGIYRTAYAKIESARVENLKALTDPLSLRLKQLESTLTQQDRVADAKTVREYREGLSEGSAGTAARNPTPSGGAAKMDEADKSVRAPLKKFPLGDDRKATEWVLEMGGVVTINELGKSVVINAGSVLPRGKFAVEKVEFPFSKDRPPAKPITELLPLAGLKSLWMIAINSEPSLMDDALEMLSSLPSLKTVHVLNGGLTDACMAHFASIRDLEILNLQNNRGITGSTLGRLAPLKKLRSLGLQATNVSPEGIRSLADLSGLTDLNIAQTPFKDADVEVLSGYRGLERLTVSQWVSLGALATLKNLVGLRYLGFSVPTENAEEQCKLAAQVFTRLDSLRLEMPAKGAAQSLGAASAFSKVTNLTVYNADEAAMAGLGKWSGLKELHLNTSVISAATLAELVTLPKIETLEISPAPEITDEGLMRFAEMKKLQALFLRSASKITDAGIAALKKLRPDLLVTR